ncbi:MAG TPA: metallophosphoesterase [Xanthobacteraceae bacterium]|nr:metallophosphoesterase [Xanthobacteraceae bacterium]
MFVLAHLSDPHIPPLPEPRLVELIGKRITGYLNWKLRRGAHHRRDTLDALVADLLAQAPDHIAVTGDLANLSLAAEFEGGRQFLARLGDGKRVSVIPGNHDAYVRATNGLYLSTWSEYLAGDDGHNTPFPFLRRRGPLALVGLSSAVPTLPFFASGRLGSAQLDRLAIMLAALAKEKAFRAILIHHPPAGDRAWLKRLEDAAGFRETLALYGAELVLSGHDHIAAVNQIAGNGKPVPVVQVPSASAAPGDPRGGGAYNLYRIGGAPGGWSCEMESRGFSPDGKIVSLGKKKLFPALNA